MNGLRKVAAILVGLIVFEVVFFSVSAVLRPLRGDWESDAVWWALRFAGIAVGLLIALFVGSRLWPKRRTVRASAPEGD